MRKKKVWSRWFTKNLQVLRMLCKHVYDQLSEDNTTYYLLTDAMVPKDFPAF